MQDSRGFMWIGTRDGLNRYDGYNFKVFTNDPDNPNSLSNNNVRDVIEDSRGNIWVATLGGGLNKFDRRKNTFISYTHDARNKNSISSNALFRIVEDGTEKFWVASQKDGLNLFDTKTNRFVRYTNNKNNPASLSHNEVRALYKDSKNNIWVGTMGGLDLFNRKNNSLYILNIMIKSPALFREIK
ncbi:MAG: two-component regulator propeller domain-containing protein [Segetibacter sp.]